MNIKDLAPGSYKVISGQVPTATPAPQGGILNTAKDVALGIGMGGLSTLQNVGSLINTGLNQTIGRGVDALAGKKFTPTDYSIKPGLSSAQVQQKLTPQNTAQSIGKGLEQTAEYFVPAAKAAQAERLVTTLTSGISNGLLKGTLNVAGKAAVQGLAAGGVQALQSGGDVKKTLQTGGTAAAISGALGTVGELSRAFKIPEYLYTKVFKNTLGDVKAEFKTDYLVNLAQTKPQEYKQLLDAGIIKTQLGGKPVLNETLAEKALDRGLKGSIKNMANTVTGGLFNSEYKVQQIAKNSSEVVKFPELQYQNILSEIAADYKDVGFGELSDEAKRLADAIFQGEGQVSVQDALAIRRLLDGTRYARSFDVATTKLSLGQQNLKQLSDVARQRLNSVKGMGEVMKDYTFYIDALEALAKEAKRRGNNQVFTLLDGILTAGGLASGAALPATIIGAGRKILNSGAGSTALGSLLNKGSAGPVTSGLIGASAGAATSLLGGGGQPQPAPQTSQQLSFPQPTTEQKKSKGTQLGAFDLNKTLDEVPVLGSVRKFMKDLGPKTVGEARNSALIPSRSLAGLPDDAPIPKGITFIDPSGAIGSLEKVGGKIAGKFASEALEYLKSIGKKYTPDSKKIVDLFSKSTDQKPVGNFVLGSFGKNATGRKLGSVDRFPEAELKKTQEAVQEVYRASDNPTSYRFDNNAWVAKMPSGENRVIYTRLNPKGQQEIINWHSVSDPKYLSQIKSFGAPTQTRTGINSLEGNGFSPLAYKGNPTLSIDNKKASTAIPFKNFDDLSTKLLGKLEGKSTVSKQFIEDLTNSADLKQPERDLFRSLLKDEPGTVNVKDFANKIKSELLPLKATPPKDSFGRVAGGGRNAYDTAGLGYRYENISLPNELRGPVADYKERIYSSPIKTSAGGHHFDASNENYFAHTRIEDLPNYTGEALGRKGLPASLEEAQGKTGTTRRVIELQSDLFQKGRLEGELDTTSVHPRTNYHVLTDEGQAERRAEIAKLEPYRNTWQDRIIREEVKQAALDGKTKLQFPTGETAMKIEGLGDGGRNWFERPTGNTGAAYNGHTLTTESLKVGKQISDGGSDWIITDVLGDGKFKAVQKDFYDQIKGGFDPYKGSKTEKQIWDSNSESFDISGNVDKENPIYKFYEKEVGRYLKNKYNAQLITDPQGVKWYEVNLKPEQGKAPIEAYGIGLIGGGALIGQKKDNN